MAQILINEVDVNVPKINTIITHASNDAQLAAIATWGQSSPRVAVYGRDFKTDLPAFRFIKSKSYPTQLKEAIMYFAVNLQENDVFALINPEVEVNPNQKDIFTYLQRMQCGRSWACWFSTNHKVQGFMVSAPVIHYLIEEMPDGLNFSDEAWITWIDKWLKSRLPQHRYFAIDALQFVKPFIYKSSQTLDAPLDFAEPDKVSEPNKVSTEPESVSVAPTAPTPLQAPVKRKPGRPAKVQISPNII